VMRLRCGVGTARTPSSLDRGGRGDGGGDRWVWGRKKKARGERERGKDQQRRGRGETEESESGVASLSLGGVYRGGRGVMNWQVSHVAGLIADQRGACAARRGGGQGWILRWWAGDLEVGEGPLCKSVARRRLGCPGQTARWWSGI
jgi:hypothetical protein